MDSKYLSDLGLLTVEAAAAAGTTTVTSTILDMAGYDGVLFIAKIGTGAADNVLKAQQGAAANMSDAADLLGTGVVLNSPTIGVLDIFRPQERYVRAAIVRGTSSTVDTLIAIRYHARSHPVSQSGLTLEQHSAPAEGTA